MRAQHIAHLAIVLLLIAPARGQVSIEEAQRRLAQRQAERAREAATAPATTRPVAPAEHLRKKYAAKPDAPESIKRWMAEQPKIRQGILDDVDRQLKQLKSQIEQFEKSSIPIITSGSGLNQTSAVDRQAERSWADRLAALRKKAADLIRQEKEIETDPQPHLYTEPSLKFKVGSVATGLTGRIQSVIDGNNLLIETGGKTLWLKGWETANQVDDQSITTAGVIITGTKQYQTVIGATRTVLVVEPFDVAQWIEVVDDDSPPPVPVPVVVESRGSEHQPPRVAPLHPRTLTVHSSAAPTNP